MAASLSSYNDDEGLISDINVTPLVDVVLVILIVFMITVPTMLKLKMQKERELDLQLPTAGNARSLSSRVTDLTIDVLRDGTYLLEGEPCTLPVLADRLEKVERTNPQRVSVMVRADKRVAWQRVISALNTCNKVGIVNCRVAALE